MTGVSLRWLLIVVVNSICTISANWITGNLCWSMPCLNGGSCFGSAYTYLCICPVHYSGVLCEKRLGLCQDNPCNNRGLCVETSLASFECRCYFGFTGPTCAEAIPRNNSLIWSSLLPVHTRVLFEMLHGAYNAKLKGKSAVHVNNEGIDFIGLLTTSKPTTETAVSTATDESAFTTTSRETTEEEYVIKAEGIRLEQIFSEQTTDGMTTNFSETSTFTTTNELEETSSTSTDTTQEPTDFSEQSSTFITSTAFEQTSTTDFTTDAEPLATTMEMTTTINASAPTTVKSHAANSRILYKLCRGILTRIFPNNTADIPHDTPVLSLTLDSSLIRNYTADTFVSWLQKHLNLSENVPPASNTSFPLTTEKSTSATPLQRVDIDDVLFETNGHTLEH